MRGAVRSYAFSRGVVKRAIGALQANHTTTEESRNIAMGQSARTSKWQTMNGVIDTVRLSERFGRLLLRQVPILWADKNMTPSPRNRVREARIRSLGAAMNTHRPVK